MTISPDELADALFDSKDANRRFVPKLAWATRDELRTLAREAAKQALLDAAEATELEADGEAYVGATMFAHAQFLRDRAAQIGKD